MLLIRDIAMPLNFTGDQRRNKGGFNNAQVPLHPHGPVAQLRQSFSMRRDYKSKWTDYERKKADAAAHNDPDKSRQ